MSDSTPVVKPPLGQICGALHPTKAATCIGVHGHEPGRHTWMLDVDLRVWTTPAKDDTEGNI